MELLKRHLGPENAEDLGKALAGWDLAVMLVTAGRIVTDATPAVAAALGRERDTLIGQSLDDAVPQLAGLWPGVLPRGGAALFGVARAGAVVPVRLRVLDGAADHTLVLLGAADREGSEAVAMTLHVAPERRTVRASGRLCRWFGRDAEALCRAPLVDLVHPDGGGGLLDAIGALFDGSRASFEGEQRFLAADGAVRAARIGATARRDADGRVERVVVEIAPLGEGTVLSLAELRENERCYRRLFEGSPMGMLAGVVGGPEVGRLTQVNEAFLRIVGYDRAAFDAGRLRWTDLTPHEHLERDVAAIAEARDGGHSRPYEKELIRADGSRVPVLAAYAVVDERGEEAVAYAVDLSPQRALDLELRQAYGRLRNIMANVSNAIGVYDLDGRLIEVNPRAVEVTGYSEQELVGMHFADLIDAPALPEAQGVFVAVIQQGKTVLGREIPFVRKDGERRITTFNAVPLHDHDGTITGAVVTAEDVTERRHTDEALRRRADELAALNLELESFSYSVSHDMRGPLRSMTGFSSILLEDHADRLDDEARNLLERIKESGAKLNALVDDMLGLAGVSQQEMDVQTVDLSALAIGCIDELRCAHPGRPVAFVAQEGLMARGDARLLELALSNLLGNAWKYSGKAEHARIEFGREDADGENAFFVRDNGVGFDAAQADNLFTPFKRLHSDRDFPGTGVGLGIVDRVVRRHGGRVWARSRPGEGAVFYFTLECR